MGGVFWCPQSKLSRSDILRKHGKAFIMHSTRYSDPAVLEETMKR